MGGEQKTHTSARVYAGGDIAMNGVSSENLQAHIEYNTTYRFGCGLFIDGECKHEGYLTKEQVEHYERLFKSDSKFTQQKDTAPYR